MREPVGIGRWLLLALLVACSSPGARPEHEPRTDAPEGAATSNPALATAPSSSAGTAPSSPRADGFIRPAGAPDPLACASDAECTYGQTYDDSGCCGTFRNMAATAQSKAYLKFTTDWRAAHCEGHACPSPPVPTEPPPCLFEVHCVAQRCNNTCR